MDGMKLTYAQKAEYLITQINTLNSGVIEFQDEETEDKKVA